VGQDTVPAMLAPGEAVLNRHQQAVVEGLLGGGFLDRLFSSVSTPHYMARGGIVPVPGFPGESAAQSVIPKILQIARQFGLTLTDAFGPGHQSPGHTRFGTAADFAGPDRSMNAAVRSLTRAGYLVGYDGRYGSQDWAGHGPAAGQGGSNAHLHVELGGKGGNIAGMIGRLKRVMVRGGGQVGRVVQGALDVGRAGAQEFAERTANASVSTPVGGGGGGGWSKSRLAGLWRSVNRGLGDPRLMAAIALAESGGRAGIVNSIGAGGLWQIHPPEPGYLNPTTNARIAGRKLRTQGLRAWEAYTNGSYRQFMARGGRVQRFANGGRPSANASMDFHTGASEQSHPAPYSIGRIKRLRRRANNRVGVYETTVDTIEALADDYEIADRRYGRTDEDFIRDDGTLDSGAVQRRVDELNGLIALREQIIAAIETAARQARAVVKTLRTLLGRLRRAVKRTKGKERTAMRKQITEIGEDITTYTEAAEGHDRDVRFGREDLADLIAERDSVAGTTASPQEQTTPDTSPDAQAIADQATRRADAATADLAAVRSNFAAFTSTGDIGSARGSSAYGSTLVDAAGGVGGAMAAGVPGGFIAGAGSTVVVVNSQSLVQGSHAENVRIADAVVTAIGTRPVRPVTQATVGG
jgi:hypothetical protein